jgi:hypothetical protein
MTGKSTGPKTDGGDGRGMTLAPRRIGVGPEAGEAGKALKIAA